MLVGQQIGPFLIEKEIGAGAMGTVYRGKYVPTGTLVALKLMAPGLGASNPAALARFEREAAILKQLKHPNIVRYYGNGKVRGTPFYAMEYLKGESLDHTIARRDRMSWEHVVELGRQLCDALQHAHDAGIVHRDLKPSNLMILPDGTLKLTDFGIAKDLDVTQITAANCTIGTAAYMSPEQCKGDPHLTGRSDLYSLGIVLYELLTGRKPFQAESAMEMFLQHCKGKFERPSKLVPDLPVWMDTLVCHLLEKDPDKRPPRASVVSEALSNVRQKVEALASAGLEVAIARRGDLPSEKRDLSEEDRAAARTLANGGMASGGHQRPGNKKPARRKKKKEPSKATGLPRWIQAVGLLGLLAALALMLVVVFQPPSAQVLHDRAENLVKAGKLAEACDGPIAEFLRIYGTHQTPWTPQILRWREEYDIAQLHTYMDRYIRHEIDRKGLPVDGTDREKQAYQAALAEYNGDRRTAETIWNELASGALTRPGTVGHDNVATVARHHLRLLAALDREEERMTGLRQQTRERRSEIDLEPLTREAFTAWRQEQLGDRLGALRLYERLRDEARKDDDGRYWALFAAMKVKTVSDGLKAKPQDEEGRVRAISDTARTATAGLTASNTSMLTLRVILHEIALLYDRDPALAEAVNQAKEGMKYVDERVK